MSYKQIRPGTLQELTLNVFMLVSTFDPATFDATQGIVGSTIIASTTGGVTFKDTPTYTDFGEDIDNCPKNCMELKHKEDGTVELSGNFVTLNKDMVALLMGAADVSSNKVSARTDLKSSDFINELWGLADYGNGGLIAIKMKRVLNTSGFSMQTTDKAKGQFAFTFTCHKSINSLADPPYEVYIIEAGSIEFTTHSMGLSLGGQGSSGAIIATVKPTGSTITWTSSNTSVATVGTTGTVSAVAVGSCVITGSITVNGATYSDTCTVNVH